MIQGKCAVCGMPGHRYGTTDPKHKFDAVACVNGLRHKLKEVEEAASWPSAGMGPFDSGVESARGEILGLLKEVDLE